MNDSQKENSVKSCKLCGESVEGNYLYEGLLKCPSCGLVFADTTLGAKELQQLYQHRYFFGDEYLDYVADKSTIQKNFQKRIETLREFSPSGRLFEIGCAYGFFLELAVKHWDASGCDIAEEPVRYAVERGFNARSADFAKLPLDPQSQDVVCMWDTIEHLAQPEVYVKKASEILKHGGCIALTTGDIGSPAARFRKSRWRLIHPPTHLFYFDRNTIGKLFDKNGLDIVHFEHCGYRRSLQQAFYSILVLNSDSPRRHRMYEFLTHLFPFSFYLNLFDIMFVIACKR
jgi:SAM-dependent methyltransferase